MKLNTPEIAWHGKEPVLSVDFCKVGSKWRLASGGADNDVKVRYRSVIEIMESNLSLNLIMCVIDVSYPLLLMF